MIPTSVYAVSPRWGLAFVWHLVRATSTPPAPTSKPVGSPPCDTPRLMGPHIPPPSRRWRTGSKPCHPLSSRPPHLYQFTSPPPSYLPPPPPDPETIATTPTYSTALPFPTPLLQFVLLSLAPPESPLKPLSHFSLRPPHSPSCILPRPVGFKPRRGRPASHLFLRHPRPAWQGVSACGRTGAHQISSWLPSSASSFLSSASPEMK
jgi:hypothetical protein